MPSAVPSIPEAPIADRSPDRILRFTGGVTETRRRRPVRIYLLASALAFQGLSGVAGGIGLVSDPSGASVGIPVDWLQGSPFPDYLIPGLVLLTVLGAGPLLILAGVWSGREWSGGASILVGLALLVWIGIEILVVGYQPAPPLQLVYGTLGVVILALAAAPYARSALRNPSQEETT